MAQCQSQPIVCKIGRVTKIILIFVVAAAISVSWGLWAVPSVRAATDLEDWMLGPFIRPVGINPLIQPKADSLFECPVQHKMVKWEIAHTFNPAAIVMDSTLR